MPVVTTEQRGLVSIIRIDRPEKLNAISAAVAVELQQAFQAFDASDQRVAILSAAGERAFTSGADVTDLPELWRAIPTVGFDTDKPIIAATSGWCVGGGIVIVMMCDLMVSTESTMFYYPEAKLGVTGGMISSLVSRMPHKLAMEIMLLGAKVTARRAYDVGFVNRVVPNGQHEAEALAMANEMLELGAAGDRRAEAPGEPGAAGRTGGANGRDQPDAGPGAHERGHAGRHPRPSRTPQARFPRTLRVRRPSLISTTTTLPARSTPAADGSGTASTGREGSTISPSHGVVGSNRRCAAGYLGPPRRDGEWLGDRRRGRGGRKRCQQAAANDCGRNQPTDHLDPPARPCRDRGCVAKQPCGAMNCRANRVAQGMHQGGSAVHHRRGRVMNDSPADDRHGSCLRRLRATGRGRLRRHAYNRHSPRTLIWIKVCSKTRDMSFF